MCLYMCFSLLIFSWNVLLNYCSYFSFPCFFLNIYNSGIRHSLTMCLTVFSLIFTFAFWVSEVYPPFFFYLLNSALWNLWYRFNFCPFLLCSLFLSISNLPLPFFLSLCSFPLSLSSIWGSLFRFHGGHAILFPVEDTSAFLSFLLVVYHFMRFTISVFRKIMFSPFLYSAFYRASFFISVHS